MKYLADARLLIDTLCLTPTADGGVLARRWAQSDARALVTLADQEGVALWLQRRIKAIGLTLVPEAGEALVRLARQDAAAALRVDGGLEAALRLIDAADVPVVLLKGAGMRRLVHRFPYGNARAPVDVDLLVPEADAQRVWDSFIASGYHAPLDPPVGGHHLADLMGPDGVAVEIHVTTTSAVPPAEAWRRATHDPLVVKHGGRARMVPNETELLWHSMAHAVVHLRMNPEDGLRLKRALDAAAILAANPAIDWTCIRDRLATDEVKDPDLAVAWLRMAAFFSGRALPADAPVPLRERPINLARALGYRLQLNAQPRVSGRWREKLLGESARGETGLRLAPANARASLYAAARHNVATRVARSWWLLTR